MIKVKGRLGKGIILILIKRGCNVSKRLCFEDLKCPYCGDAPGWLFGYDELGEVNIYCNVCGKTFIAIIYVEPKVKAVYKLELAYGVDYFDVGSKKKWRDIDD
jgi:hypothetical protein